VSARPKFIPGERQGKAIQRVKVISAALSGHALAQIILMREMAELLYDLRRTDEDPEIQKLIDRLDELVRLENQQELQSWQITVDRVMQAAWQRLP